MAQTLQFLRSSTPGNKPAELLVGQVAFNLIDKRLYVGDGTDNITDVLGNVSAGVTGKGFFESDLDIVTAVNAAKSYTDSQVAALINSAPDVLNTLKELSDALAADPNFATTVANGLAVVTGNLNNEVSRAQSAEASLAGALSAEANRAQSAEGALAASVNAEELRALAAEGVLADNLSAEATRAIGAENAIIADLAAELARASAAEAALSFDLNTEATRAGNAEAVLATDLSTETARAQAAEGLLQDNINSEAAARIGGDDSLAASLATESARAQSAEAALAARVLVLETVIDLGTYDAPSGGGGGSHSA
jgi:hypothetical protein